MRGLFFMEGEMIENLTTAMDIFLKLANILVLLYAAGKFLGKPHNSLEQRVTALETEVKDIKQSLHEGNDNFKEIFTALKVLIHSVMALLEFEMQYCLSEHKEMSEGLKDAKKDLEDFLREK